MNTDLIIFSCRRGLRCPVHPFAVIFIIQQANIFVKDLSNTHIHVEINMYVQHSTIISYFLSQRKHNQKCDMHIISVLSLSIISHIDTHTISLMYYININTTILYTLFYNLHFITNNVFQRGFMSVLIRFLHYFNDFRKFHCMAIVSFSNCYVY